MTKRSVRMLPVAILLVCGCAHVAPGSSASEQSTPPAALSPEADNFFAQTDLDANGGSLVIDLDALRSLGFLKPAAPGDHNVWSDLVAFTLPQIAVALKKPADREFVARTAVLFSLLRDWEGWPTVRRLGILLPGTDDPEHAGERLVGLIAFDGTVETSQSLLHAIAAADRAAGESSLTWRGEDLCIVRGKSEPSWCLRPGPGYLSVGTLRSLNSLPSLLGGTRMKQPRPAIVRVRLNVPALGKGFFAVEPDNGIVLRGVFASAQPAVASLIEQKLQDALDTIAAQHHSQESLIGPVLARTQAGLAADPQAPLSLRVAASRLTVEQLLDPEGTWAAVRNSAHVGLDDNVVTFEARVPEASVLRAAHDGTSFAAFAVIGLLSSIAVPAYLKYECQTRETEAEAVLSAAAAEAHEVQANGRSVAGLDSIGFKAPVDSHYTYCLGTECVPCTASGCYVPPAKENPCLRLAQARDTTAKYKFLMCAVGDLDGETTDGDVDVWVVTEDGTPQHLQDDCR